MEYAKKYPGGSKSRVNKAGDAVRNNMATSEDLHVIDEWRAAHRSVLNTFQAVLRNRTSGNRIAVAQRHKRKRTIFDKLDRLPKMELSRMDDVAGCRLIFKNIEALTSFRSNFHKARFDHKLRNQVDKYNYIKEPKNTGYRGIHDVYEYNVRSKVGKDLTGLYVEIQYRTLVQHSWATAVEVIGFVTENQPKFQKGDDRYMLAMALASEILARAHEGVKGPKPEMLDRDLVQQFLMFDNELNLIKTLRGLNAANKAVSEKRNAILIFGKSGSLDVRTFRDATDALRALFDLEKQFPDQDIVLVKADRSDDVRLAFKNYFSDARDFIKLVESGCEKLSGSTNKKSKQPKNVESKGAPISRPVSSE